MLSVSTLILSYLGTAHYLSVGRGGGGGGGKEKILYLYRVNANLE